MFWNIVIGIASYALQLILTPKPQDAKPAALDEMSVPTAEEGIEIPVLFGTRPLKAPNVVWHGHRKVEAIKGARRYGFVGPRQTIGHKYYLGMHMGLCHSAIDAIYNIRVGEKIAWEGANKGGRLTISKPNLFGGQDREGGISGAVDIELGLPTQGQNDYLVTALGADNVPGHRGITGAVLRRVYLGTTPYIKPWEFTAQRVFKRSDGSAQWYSAKAGIGDGTVFSPTVNRVLTSSLGTSQSDSGTDIKGGYVANVGGLSVWKYPSMNAPLWTRNDVGAPQSLTLDGNGNLIVAHTFGATVTVYDVATGAAKATIAGMGATGNVGITSRVYGGITYIFQLKGSTLYLASGSDLSFTKIAETAPGVAWLSQCRSVSASSASVYLANNAARKVVVVPWTGAGFGSPKTVDISADLFGNIVSVSYISSLDAVLVIDTDSGLHLYNADLSTRLRYAHGADEAKWNLALASHLMSNRIEAGDDVIVFRAETSNGNAIVKYSISSLSLISLTDASDLPYVNHNNSAYSNSGFDPDSDLLLILGSSGAEPLAAWSLPPATMLDMNPSHIIRECLTDKAWGMGDNESDIDAASFTAAADTFFNEGFGLSPLWAREAEIVDFIQMVQAHVDAYVYTSRRTGKWVIKPIRADYDIDTIPVIDEDDVITWNEVVRRPTNEAVNAVIVKYFDRSTGKDASHTVVNVAAVQQAGKVISVTRDYPAICRRSLAQRVGERDLRSLGSGMISGRITCKRTVEKLNPGDPFRLVSSRHKLSGEVMRVVDMKFGDGRSNAITIQLAQDVFSLAAEPVFSDGEFNPPPAQDELLPPSPRLVWEMPYREARQMVGDSDLAAMLAADPDAGLLQASAVRPATGASINAEMQVDDGTGYAFADMLEFAPGGTLAADVAVTSTTMTFAAGAELDDATIGMLATIKGATSSEDEVVRIDGITGNVLTIARGCLDTIPRTHAAGASVVVFDDFSMTDSKVYTSTDSVGVKLLTVGDGVLELADAPADLVNFDARAIRPLRPANVQVNGAGFGTVDLVGVNPIPVTWARRNRLTETSPLAWDEADVTPEAGQTTTVTLTDLEGAVLHSYTGITGTSQNVDPADFGGEAEGYIVVSASRDGLDSLQGFGVHVTLVAAPVNTVIPVISGTPSSGQTLTVTNGTWTE